MKPESNSQASQIPEASVPSLTGGLSPEALQRRSALLRGLGKGTAVLAASVPIQTLASPKITARLCTVSGVQSNVGSGRTGLKTDTCTGYSAFYYKTLSNWPNVTGTAGNPQFSVDSVVVNKNTPFNDVFGSGSTAKFMDILSTATSGNLSPTAEQVWVAALLNGKKMPANYPTQYTASQVRVLYANTTPTQGGTSTVRNDAFNFFKGFVQGMDA